MVRSQILTAFALQRITLVPPNLAFNSDRAGGRPSAPAGTAG
jgi:hypothetical protein